MLRVIETIREMKEAVNRELSQGKRIGFVPTMGYLHEGHLSLVRKASQENDIVAVSIFVNPTQFGVNEDYSVYPKNLERDVALLKSMEVNYVFSPGTMEMYPPGYSTYVEVEGVTEKLCGASRPGHFRGVATVVNKLLNIINPHRAYFGLKDAQQVVVLQKMVRELDLPVEIIPCPIVREADGLAMSSRNVNLTPKERRSALILSKSLFAAEKAIRAGEKRPEVIQEKIGEMTATEPEISVDYIEIVDMNTMKDADILGPGVLIALAAKVGSVRLIDNIIVEENSDVT